ncbi:BAG family molecular chaperone regulator 1 [Crotalus adamanteus]|uniref:BAG family molecular chaperone regulator 1 n=1 Tax=Crotalus adamanteus TaxID=8729 RepID=A0AAW1B3Q0_CROAD
MVLPGGPSCRGKAEPGPAISQGAASSALGSPIPPPSRDGWDGAGGFLAPMWRPALERQSAANSPEEETELKKLKVLEKSVEQLAKKIDEVNKELREIQKDFLAKNNQTEALSQLDKRIKGIAEQFMKILEQIDAIILPDNFNDSKQKKKGLVKKIQAFLAQCDTVEGNIGQEMDKLHSKNMVLAE